MISKSYSHSSTSTSSLSRFNFNFRSSMNTSSINIENDIIDDPYESEIEIVRPKSLWFRFCKWFQSREKLKYRPRKKSTDEVHFKRLFQAKSNLGQTKEEKIIVSTYKLHTYFMFFSVKMLNYLLIKLLNITQFDD